MVTNNTEDYSPDQYNIQTGGSSGTLNDIVPSATSGVPFISQGSSSQPVFGTMLVAGGGTGLTTATAYAVLCGGTTSTGAFQSIASVGNSGEVLKSNGAGALPTFQAVSSGNYKFNMNSTDMSDPADVTTYYLSNGRTLISTSSIVNSNVYKYFIPSTGTITAVYGVFTVGGTLGSSENSTLSIRLNDTTDTTVSASIQWTATANTFNNTGLGIAVSAGDFFQLKLVTPTWTTNPTSTGFSITVKLT